MPSPFPGMDPFIEGQRWKTFHSRFINTIGDALVPRVRPRYVVDVEERVYLEYDPEERPRVIEPDVAVAGQGPGGSRAGATAVALEPVIVTLPIPVLEREHFIVIRDRQHQGAVAAVEVLSPTNKRAGSDGLDEYLRKRGEVLRSGAHLVELDLLRGGERLPTIEPLPIGDYYAIVSRVEKRPGAAVYAWGLRRRLPEIPVPLAGSDPDVVLDLQAVFASAYDRAGFDYALDYQRPVEPPLSEDDAAWVRQILAGAELPASP